MSNHQGQGRRRRLHASLINNTASSGVYDADGSRLEISTSLSHGANAMHNQNSSQQQQPSYSIATPEHDRNRIMNDLYTQEYGNPLLHSAHNAPTSNLISTPQTYHQSYHQEPYQQSVPAHRSNRYDYSFQHSNNFAVTPDSRSTYVSSQQGIPDRNDLQNITYGQHPSSQQFSHNSNPNEYTSPYATSSRRPTGNYNQGIYSDMVTPEQTARYDLPPNRVYTDTDTSCHQVNKKRSRSDSIHQGRETLDFMPASPYAISQTHVQKPRTDVSPTTGDEKQKKTICRCVKSRCLKLYCDCFQLGVLCNAQCQCVNCLNNEAELGPYGKLTLAREEYLIRKPNSFGQKPKKVGGRCACKNNRCLKKYCDCFNNGVFCSDKCQCIDCANQDLSVKKSAKKSEADKKSKKDTKSP